MKRTKPANSANYWRNSKNESRNNSLCQSAGTRKTNIFILVLSFALTGFLFFHNECSAQTPGVVFNEIMWMGSSVSYADEWLELYNTSDSPVDFSVTPWSIYRNDIFMLAINEGTVGANGYFLISNNKKDYIFSGGESILNVDPDYIDSSISLYNSAAQYKLYDATDNSGNLVDTADDGSGVPLAGDNGVIKKSMERKNNCQDGTNGVCWQTCFKPENLDESSIDCATPRAQNSKEEIPEPVVYPHDIRINELFPAPSKESGLKEYIELYNFGEEPINLDGWMLRDKTGSDILSGVTGAKKYVLFRDTVSLNNNGDEIKLYNPNGEMVSEVSYEEAKDKDYSYSWKEKDKKWKWTSIWTPEEENKFDEDISYPEGVYINEILPDPKGDEEKKEYIELFNSNEKDVDLFKWMLKDSGKTSKYIFPEKSEIKSEDYLLVKRADFNFALNNSGDEEVSLLNPAGKVVSQVKYDGSDENVSYNFTGRIWRWSRYLTPGEPNRFNNLPQVKVEKDDKIYEDIYAEFKAEVKDPDKDEIKVTWDFGDGHKSYLEETKHKYEKKGKYKVILKVTDGSEEMLREFKIEVEEFPEYDMEFFTICPNPSGSDTENEWLVVKNESDEEVNLKNWSIATGWDNLYNHPIYEDLEIDGGELKVIKRDVCKFTLHNQQAKLELRYPNGKTAAEIEYDRDNSTADDEIYQKTRDGWIWIAPKAEEIAEVSPRVAEILGEEIFTDDLSYFLGGQSLAGIRNYRLSLMKFILNQNLAEIIAQNSGKVLGVSTNKELGNRYIFTRDNRIRDHYFISFLKNTGRKINYLTNTIINKLN